MVAAIPPDILTHTPIFHITDIGNLPAILKCGHLLSCNTLKNSGIKYMDIANNDIQSKRATKTVPINPGGRLHDYVPFYFAPRSPMLRSNHIGNISNAKPQRQIIHLVSAAQHVEENGLNFVFYNAHAIMIHAQPFNDLTNLNQIDWEIFFEPPLLGKYAKYWNDRYDDTHPKWTKRQSIRMSEFLVHHAFPINLIERIGVYDPAARSQTMDILAKSGVNINVEIKPEWYY